jgi:hypothetical protein
MLSLREFAVVIFDVVFCGFCRGFLRKRCFCCGVLVVSMWWSAWQTWCKNSVFLGGEK